MTPELVVQIVRQALLATFWISAPLLIIGLAAGILVSLVQIVTSIQDTGFSTIPRLGAFLAGLLLLMPWMLEKIVSYTTLLLRDLGRYAH
ncbi:MAG TPA: flagellar biosynthetic protein FliQ [Bryobacteraceae bacterium]|nr:flagellar biosynthetic protein FliQ [Bryobacteraceae bacterium]